MLALAAFLVIEHHTVVAADSIHTRGIVVLRADWVALVRVTFAWPKETAQPKVIDVALEESHLPNR